MTNRGIHSNYFLNIKLPRIKKCATLVRNCCFALISDPKIGVCSVRRKCLMSHRLCSCLESGDRYKGKLLDTGSSTMIWKYERVSKSSPVMASSRFHSCTSSQSSSVGPLHNKASGPLCLSASTCLSSKSNNSIPWIHRLIVALG